MASPALARTAKLEDINFFAERANHTFNNLEVSIKRLVTIVTERDVHLPNNDVGHLDDSNTNASESYLK
jgi:hypothetical protein